MASTLVISSGGLLIKTEGVSFFHYSFSVFGCFYSVLERWPGVKVQGEKADIRTSETNCLLDKNLLVQTGLGVLSYLRPSKTAMCSY